MKVREFKRRLDDLIKEHPDVLDMEAIAAIDDEGNGFNPVEFSPSRGIYEDREFISEESIEDYERDTDEINSVCIN